MWVDDITVAASSTLLLNEIKQHLSSKFNMKELGPLSSFLGIHFEQKEDAITMSQSQYLKKILEKFGFENCKPRGTPCEANPEVYNTDTFADENDPRKYRQMVGSLLVYAMICTRHDLSYVVTKLSQHLSKPTSGDLLMLNHVFRYVKSTVDYHLTFRKGGNDLQITAYCDADWASSLDDRHSISGYCTSLLETGPLISWKSRKQSSIALSTCEAEYISLSATCQEISYPVQLLKDVLDHDFQPATLMNDNQGAIALVKNPIGHMRSKHIDIRYHYVHECFKQGRSGTCKNCVTCVSQIGNTKSNPELEKSRKFVTHLTIFKKSGQTVKFN